MELCSIPEAFQTKIRIAIIAALMTGKKDFNTLKALTGATDGNLSVQLTKLEEMGYTSSRKGFLGKRTRTVYAITEFGAKQFREYVMMLQRILHAEEAKNDT